MKLSEVSYYQTGGTCSDWHEPDSLEKLQSSMRALQGKPWFLLGAGSNSLVMDTHWPGGVLSLRKMQEVVQNRSSAIFGAGWLNSKVVEYAYERNWSGAEFMYGLPGQLGGTVRMNARCYGGEISQIVQKVWTVDIGGTLQVWDQPEACFRGYKDTVFMEQPLVVAQVEIAFVEGQPLNIKKDMDFCLQDRTQKGQYLYPSCGCVFKNCYDADVSVPSGMLLQRAGVMGMVHGGAMVSPQHANFVYNKAQATSRDILELTLQMREKVWETFGVWLEYEMEVLGDIPEDLKSRFYEQRAPEYKACELAELRKIFQQRQPVCVR